MTHFNQQNVVKVYMPVSGLSLKKVWQVLLLCFWGALSYHVSAPADLLEGFHGKAMWRGKYLTITQRERERERERETAPATHTSQPNPQGFRP